MTNHFGRVPVGTVLPVVFGTYNGSGASVAATGLAVTDIEIYKGTSMTQRASDAGYTLMDTDGLDLDGITGINGFSIDTGDNTDSGFYSVGSFFTVIVSAITVDSQTVSFVAATFSLGPAEDFAGYPKVQAAGHMQNTTIATLASQVSFTLTAGSADNDAYNGCFVVVTDATTSAQKCVGLVQDYVGSTKTVTLAYNPGVFTMAAGDTIDIVAGPAPTSFQTWDEVLTGATHNIANSAGRRLRSIQNFGDYALGRVWVDENNGSSTGTTDYEDATVTNRANDLDNAQTVADSIGLHDINITNGNAITLTAALEGYDMYGNQCTLALGNQNVGGTEFFDFADITGIGTSTGGRVIFNGCDLGNCTLPGDLSLAGCGLDGTLTISSAGDTHLIDCYSEIAGAGAPTIDMGGAVGAGTLSVRRQSGGLNVTNIATGDVVSIDALTGGTITVTMTGGTVEIRGAGLKGVTINGSGGTVTLSGVVGVVTDNSGGAVTITQTSVLNRAALNAEMIDVMETDTHAQPGQGTPPATASYAQMMGYTYKTLRNRKTQTATQFSLFNDDATTVDQKSALSDDGTTTEVGEMVTGP